MKYLRALLLAAVVLSFGGCASQLQFVKGAQSAAAVSLRASEDLNLTGLVFGLCATPYSAIIRHPDLVPGIGALCLPGGNLSNPANLLSAIK